MRFLEVFRYEIRYRVRSPSTWIFAVFLFLVMMFGTFVAANGPNPVLITAPQQVAQRIVLFGGLFGLLVSAALFGDAAMRDVAAGMDPLLYTTRLRKIEYLGGRFLAAAAINAVLVLALPLGHWATTMLPAITPSSVGPIHFASYWQPLVLFLWPNIILVGSILFLIGTFARQVIPVYLGAIAFFISYIVAANYWSGIGNAWLSTLADPLGINALENMTRYWTAAERNTRLVGFPGMLLLNRGVWLSVAAMLLVVLHRGFRFAHVAENARRERRRTIVDAPSEQRSTVDVPRIAGVFGLRTRMRQMLAVARASLIEVTSGRAFKIALLGAIGLTMLWGWNATETVFDTTTWPVTYLVVTSVLSQRNTLIPWLVIALYAGELVWKDREVGTAEIADAVPVSDTIALGGRFLALIAIIAAFHAAFVLAGVLIQTLQGYHHYELGLYFRVVFGLNLLDDLLLAAFAMAVHVLVNQKYVAYIVVLASCVLALMAGPARLPYLAIYNSGPRWTYSDMNGFGPFLRPFVWFKAYWAAWAMLLGVLAIPFWVRGREPGLRKRFSLARSRFRGPAVRTAGVAVTLIALLGGYVFYNTNVLNADPVPSEVGRPQAEYEQRYARFKNAPQPVVATADLRFEIYPDEPAVDMRGSYRLLNRTNVPIDSIHVVIDREIEAHSISLDRTAKSVVVDDKTGYRIFALAQPLRPGDSLKLSFDVAFRPRGFRSRGIPTAVVANGAYLDRRWLPFVGYQPLFELSDNAARQRFGLQPLAPMPGPGDAEARGFDDPVRNEGRVPVDLVVGTAGNQTAVVDGVLRRSWTENGRRYTQYTSDVASTFSTAVFSAKYAVREDRWRDVALQIFSHPAHGFNVDRMAEAMKASLDYYTTTFGPYQFQNLRVVEAPPYGVKGRAFPGTVLFAEDFFITRAEALEFDQTFFGTAHEIAHQWWGGQVRPAYVRGGDFISETLANYSAMLVTEKTFGAEAARKVYAYQLDRYLRRRADFPTDVPLIEVEDHPHVAYGKGAVAMYTLRDQVGLEPINAALRRFVEKHRNAGPPYATSLDLLAELRAATPDSLQYLLTDLFETITLWDVKTERAAVERLNTGEYQVTLDVVAKKMRADRVGKETETPMDDFVDVAVLGPNSASLYLQRHRIHSGKQTIRINVRSAPSRAGIDPYRKLIDRQGADNVVEVKAAAP